MIACKKPLRLFLMRGLVGLAGAAGLAPGATLAQDCKLSVQAAPQVLHSGQNASVNVFAHFPAPPAPNAPYAFAAATFDVHASDPLWTFATAGAIVGNDVLGIHVSQAHAPQVGIFADPSNPLRVWHGVFTPQANAPALVEVAADPTSFSVYPSKLTSSSAQRDAEGGNDFILVNPLRVGRWVAAPGPGTAIQVHDDVIVDGQIITGENFDSARIGLLPSGTENPRASSTRVAFLGDPVTFTATVQLQDAQRSRIGSMTVTFNGASGGSGHVGGANFSFCDGSVRFVKFDGFLGGVYVAAGDLDAGGNGTIPGLVVAALPQTVEARAGTGTLLLTAANTYGGATWTLRYDRPVVAVVRGADGQPRAVTLDRIDMHSVREVTKQLQSSNNLKQLSVGCHVFEAAGVQQMSVTPTQAE